MKQLELVFAITVNEDLYISKDFQKLLEKVKLKVEADNASKGKDIIKNFKPDEFKVTLNIKDIEKHKSTIQGRVAETGD